jgi:hypothetical protein
MKHILPLSILLFLSGCASVNQTSNTNITLNCDDSYVKYLKYNPYEAQLLTDNRKRTVYYVGKTDILDCNSYPCLVCTKFMCKNYKFKRIKYFDKEQKQLYNANIKYIKHPNSENQTRLFEGKKTHSSNADYTWNVFKDTQFEYEQLTNTKTGRLIYELATPVVPNTNAWSSQCDIDAYDLYNNFHHGY